jgi:hypothetical protein
MMMMMARRLKNHVRRVLYHLQAPQVNWWPVTPACVRTTATPKPRAAARSYECVSRERAASKTLWRQHEAAGRVDGNHVARNGFG